MPKYDFRVRKPSATEDEYYIIPPLKPPRKNASSIKQLNETLQRNEASQSGNGSGATKIQQPVSGKMIVRTSQKETTKDLENSEVNQVNKTSSKIVETDDSKIQKRARGSLKKQLTMNEKDNEMARETDSAHLDHESKITDIYPTQSGSKSSILALEDVSKEVLQDDESTDLPPDSSISSKNGTFKRRKVSADSSDIGTKVAQPEKICSRKNAIAAKKATNVRDITLPEVQDRGIMRYNEKRKLAQNIKRLPAKMIVDLIQIIEKFENTSYDTIDDCSDFFEINLDTLQDITLLTIEAFVNSTLGLNTRTNKPSSYLPHKTLSSSETMSQVAPLQPLADLSTNSRKTKKSRDLNQTLPNVPSTSYPATTLNKNTKFYTDNDTSKTSGISLSQKAQSPPKTMSQVAPSQPLADQSTNSRKTKQSRDLNQTLPNAPSTSYSATMLNKKNTSKPTDVSLSQKTQSPPIMNSKVSPLQQLARLFTSSQKTKQSEDLNQTMPNVPSASYSATLLNKKNAKFHTDNDKPKSSGISLSQKIQSTPKMTLPQPTAVTLTKSRKTKQSGNLNQTLPNAPSAYSAKLSEPKMVKSNSTQSFQVESYTPSQLSQRMKSPSNANKTLPTKRTILGVKQPQSSLRNGINGIPESYAINKPASPTLEQKEAIRKLRVEDQERRRKEFASITSLSERMELMDWMDAQF
ncbi:bromodomain extra-terminal - transcription regulation domain-containing protein [Ditylenchus destructor]|nr:bromodomain extra-terminal - transcription regulation domain-containing protein [Ditylenchus destructor]